MRFTSAIVAALSAALTEAVIITNSNFDGITVGVPFTVTYSQATGPVSLFLGTGSSANLVKGAMIGTSSGASGSITWTPTSGGSFAFEIDDSGAPTGAQNPNYSQFFTVSGATMSTTGVSTTMGMSTTTGMTSSMTTSMTTMTTSSKPASNNTTVILSTTSKASNATMTTATKSSTGTSSKTGTSSSGPSSTGTTVPSSMAAGIASPLAFVFLALGALVTLN